MDAIGPAKYLVWAAHPNARRLLKKINAFFEEIQINGVFQKIYNRYYAYVDEFDYVDLRTFHWRVKMRLPHYLSIIQDARNLARKMNLDPNKWSSLTKTLPLLSKQEFYRNATYGYCRGGEPIEYVKQIMIYYDILRHDVIEYRTQQVPSYPSSNRAA